MNKRMLLLIPVAVFIGIIILFKTIFFIGYVPTESMEPTLKANSIIFGTRIHSTINEGDIIVFKHDGSVLVKRVVGIGGQDIEVEGTQYSIPNNCYFVMGDNRDNSWDSRFWENPFVGEKDIIAKL